MSRRRFFFLVLLGWVLLGGMTSLEDVAREYRLVLRYDWNLGYGELKSEKTNRFCRVYMNMPYVVVDGRVYYFDQGVVWETNGRMVLPPAMERVVREFAAESGEGTKAVPFPPGNAPRQGGETNRQSMVRTNEIPAKAASSVTNQGTTSQAATQTNQTPSSRPLVGISPSSNTLARSQTDITNTPSALPVRDLFRPIRTIILDPGHGGKDPGGIGKGGVKEKEIVLEVTDLLKRALEQKGYRVVLTRSVDRYLSLSDRVAVAYDAWNAQEGAIFLSLHANISLNPRVRGIEIYYLSDKASDASASAVEIAENAGFSMDDVRHTESFYSVLNTLMREGVSRVSRVLARDMQQAMKVRFSEVSVKSANFYVLRFSPLPAVLCEIGYLSHPEEVKKLMDPSYQKDMVREMAQGVDVFIRRYNARRGSL